MQAFSQSVLQNFLVPADGSTHSVLTEFVATANGYQINWNTFSNDVFKFVPQGVYADNSAGAADLVIQSQTTGFRMTIPAGAFIAFHFPAAPNDVWTATGNNPTARIFWVDYPILPFIYGGSIPSTVTVANVPLPVAVPVSVAGSPYLASVIPQTQSILTGNLITGNSTTAFPPGTAFLRKLQLQVTANAAMAVAGLEVITVTLNGVTVWTGGIHLDAAAPVGKTGNAFELLIDFDGVAPAAAGNLVVTLATALTTGRLYYNAWFA